MAKKNGPYVTPPEERFWPKVDVRADDECWPWLASVKQMGYGCFYDGEKLTQAHRFALRLKLNRNLLSKEVARHTCDFPPCCNPNHLVVGSQADNINDLVERGRHWNRIKTHCPRGHEYDGVVKTNKGSGFKRYCRTCKEANRKRNAVSI